MMTISLERGDCCLMSICPAQLKSRSLYNCVHTPIVVIRESGLTITELELELVLLVM